MEKKYKILIVDDDEAVRNLYVEIFKSKGFEVIEAADGLDGIEKALANLPDVIFTGIIMPRMDGFSLKESLEKNVTTSNIPVVMSSHMGREEDCKKAAEVGIKDFFVLDLVTPKEVAARVLALFNSEKYGLRLNIADNDTVRLIRNMKLKENFSCIDCGEEMILDLKIADFGKKEFSGKIICPKCGK